MVAGRKRPNRKGKTKRGIQTDGQQNTCATRRYVGTTTCDNNATIKQYCCTSTTAQSAQIMVWYGTEWYSTVRNGRCGMGWGGDRSSRLGVGAGTTMSRLSRKGCEVNRISNAQVPDVNPLLHTPPRQQRRKQATLAYGILPPSTHLPTPNQDRVNTFVPPPPGVPISPC